MTDRDVSVGCVVACGSWMLVVLLLMLSWLLGDDRLSERLAFTALVASAAAATATVRMYFVNQNRMMKNAFDLGRDSAGRTVRPLR